MVQEKVVQRLLNGHLDRGDQLVGGVVIDHFRHAADRSPVHLFQGKDDIGKVEDDRTGEDRKGPQCKKRDREEGEATFHPVHSLPFVRGGPGEGGRLGDPPGLRRVKRWGRTKLYLPYPSLQRRGDVCWIMSLCAFHSPIIWMIRSRVRARVSKSTTTICCQVPSCSDPLEKGTVTEHP